MFLARSPPFAGGPVHAIVADGLGGWVVVGGFTSATGQSRLSFSPDCLIAAGTSEVNCLPAAPPSPTAPLVEQAGSRVTMRWTLPAGSPTWTGVRVEAGRPEGASDLGVFDLPAW